MRKLRTSASALVTAPRTLGDEDPLRGLLPVICMIGLTVHVAFLGLFLIDDVLPMVAVNIGSLVWYALMLVWVRRTRTAPAVALGLLAVEVIAHAAVATTALGWDSGFHYYALLVVPVIAVATIRPVWLKTAVVGSAVLAYLGLDLWLRSPPGNRELGPDSLNFLHYFNVLAALLVLAVIANRYYLLMTQMHAALQVMATTDPLTQLPNRNSILETIAFEDARASRGHALSFIMCDIDHFKQINDRAGHNGGDAVLQTVSRAMAAGVRSTDAIGRWGGEEFLVVLPNADAAEAASGAERIRRDVAGLAVLIAGCPLKVTVTLGVATLEPGESAASAIARADAALYEGKRRGRNRVVVATRSARTDEPQNVPHPGGAHRRAAAPPGEPIFRAVGGC